MLRSLVVAATLLVALLAGCIGDDAELDPQDEERPSQGAATDGEERLKPAERTRLERELGAIEIVAADDPDWDAPNATRDDWFLLSVDATPAGQVAAFAWEIPPDAVVQTLDGEGQRVVLDFAVALGPMGTPAGLPEGTDWVLLTLWERFDEASGTWKASRIGLVSGLTQTVNVKSGLGGEETSTSPPMSAPFSQIIQYDGLSPGDTLYFVLAARSTASDSFGIGMRVLGQEFAGQDAGTSPTLDWNDFQRLVGEPAPYAPLLTGTAENLHMALYVSDTRIVDRTVTTTSADMQEPEDELPEDLSPFWTARQVTLNSATEWGGWSYAVGGYSSVGEFGSWAVDGDIHGNDCSGTVPFLSYEPLVPEGLHIDSDPAVFQADQEGDGPSAIEVTLTKTGTLLVEGLGFRHISIGAKISDLVGLPYWSSCRA